MEITIAILVIIFIIIGVLGSFLPVLPGPPISFAALFLFYFIQTYSQQLNVNYLIIFGILTLGITILDFYLPVWGTKKYGGTKAGKIGSTIGLILGLFVLTAFVGPLSIIIGPFLGAYVGEIITGQNSKVAFKSAWGSFVGFLAGTVMKVGLCVSILIYAIRIIWY